MCGMLRSRRIVDESQPQNVSEHDHLTAMYEAVRTPTALAPGNWLWAETTEGIAGVLSG